MSSELPKTIKAIVAPQTGDIDVLQLIELPFPEPQPDEIVIKLQFAGVNYIDNYFRGGLYAPKELPIRLGQEGVGTILRLPTNPAVLSDEEYKQRGFQVGARALVSQQGCFATYISAPWSRVSPLPHSPTFFPSALSSNPASALPLQTLTAITFMTETYRITGKDGETILIHAAAGGFGLAAIQVAKALAKERGGKDGNVTIIGTTSTEEKAKIAKEHGADYVILYTKEDVVKRVLEITNGRGVDAVFDGVGKDTFEDNFKLLARKGNLVMLGNASGPPPAFSPLKLSEKNIKVARPSVMNYLVTPKELHTYMSEFFALIERGDVTPLVHKVYPFSAEGVQQSQRDITSRATVGRLVVRIADDEA